MHRGHKRGSAQPESLVYFSLISQFGSAVRKASIFAPGSLELAEIHNLFRFLFCVKGAKLLTGLPSMASSLKAGNFEIGCKSEI